MAIELERRPGHVVARVFGLFARDDARAVCEVLARDQLLRVRLDLQETRGCEPTALATLADALRELPARLQVVGLCWEDRRLLAYFGVPDARAEDAYDVRADES
jgi:hypothetical protein